MENEPTPSHVDRWKCNGEFLIAAIREDRQEIRDARLQIFNLCSFLAASDFAITLFILGKDNESIPSYGVVLCDLAICAVIAVLGWRRFKDASDAQSYVEQREKKIKALCSGEMVDVNDVKAYRKPSMVLHSLIWMPSVSVGAILLKMFVILSLSKP